MARKNINRRRFLSWIGWGGICSFFGISSASTLRFFTPQVLYEPPTSFKAGHPEDYPLGSVSEKWIKKERVWIIRDEKGIYALLAICTHLGCTPKWFEEDNRFQCPCHGSNFTREGDVIAGPAPRPLDRLAIYIANDGQIVVDKSLREYHLISREGEDFLLRV